MPRPYVQTFPIPVREGMTVLEGLHYIKENLDASLVWRYSCRMGICGSCGMLLNGRPTLACNTQILHIADGSHRRSFAELSRSSATSCPDLRPMFDKHRSLEPVHRACG